MPGEHGLTHRALDRRAAVPGGTASNSFPSRDALLIAVMERVWELHHEDMQTDGTPPTRTGRRATLADAVDLIAASLVRAATTQRVLRRDL